MELSGAISYIARAEARRVRPITDPEDLLELDARVAAVGGAKHVPTLQIWRDADKRLRVSGAVSPSHDNAGRMQFMVSFVESSVLPLVEPGIDVTGTYRIELHDSYSYLPGRSGYSDCLSFGRALDAQEHRVALFPDPYHIGGFGGLLQRAAADAVPWERKTPALFFAGTTTGDRDAAKNERIRACVWALSQPDDVARMHITKVAQMDLGIATTRQPLLPRCLHAAFGVEDHFAYRYQVNIVGNTACWSRLPMLLSSGSLAVHVRHRDAMWYYPLLQEGCHFVAADSVDGPDLLKARYRALSDDAGSRRIVANANTLAARLFDPCTAASYAAQLLEECAWAGRA